MNIYTQISHSLSEENLKTIFLHIARKKLKILTIFLNHTISQGLNFTQEFLRSSSQTVQYIPQGFLNMITLCLQSLLCQNPAIANKYVICTGLVTKVSIISFFLNQVKLLMQTLLL